jgi:hypothetical protein
LQALLHNPAVQAGVIPFIVALVVAELLQRVRLSGLALVAAFGVTVYLTNAFSLGVLTAPRKIVLLGFVAPLFAILPTLFQGAWVRPLLAALGGAAAIWMGWRIFEHQPYARMFLWSAGSALYTGWLVFWTGKLHNQPVRAGAAGLALGLGTGVAAIFGASLMLGSFGAALGAAAGAYLLIHMLANNYLPCGYVYTLPLALIAGLAGSLAAMSTELPWYALIALAAIPPAAHLVPISGRPKLWVQSILLSAAPLLCGAVAVFLTWRVAGAPPL